jgi:hypothetical protein
VGLFADGLVATTKPACEEADADDRGQCGERVGLGLLDQRVGSLVLEPDGVVGDRLGGVAVLGDQLTRRFKGLFDSRFAAGNDRIAGAVDRVCSRLRF